MKNTDSDNRVDKIMESLTGLQKAAAPDFFYTRLTGKMQTELLPAEKSTFIFRHAVPILTVFFIINIISLTQLNKQTVHTHKPAPIETFAEAYGMNTMTVYE